MCDVVALRIVHTNDNMLYSTDLVQVIDEQGSPFILLSSDCTPRMLHFGRLQADVHTFARYPFWDGTRWTTLTLDKYLQTRTSRYRDTKTLTKGTLEMLASGVEVAYSAQNGEDRGFSRNEDERASGLSRVARYGHVGTHARTHATMPARTHARTHARVSLC